LCLMPSLLLHSFFARVATHLFTWLSMGAIGRWCSCCWREGLLWRAEMK
jgi:hypothetical protein